MLLLVTMTKMSEYCFAKNIKLHVFFVILYHSLSSFLASRDECPGSLCHSPIVRVDVGV